MRSPLTNELPSALQRVGRYEILLDLQDEGFVSLMVARVRGPNAGSSIVELAKVEHALAREAEVKAAFLAEARAAGRVRHANFVHPTDTLIHEGDLYGATEFTLGVRLDELWRAAAAARYEIPLPVTLRIILDVLAGLSALHARHARGASSGARSIVHGDVAPTNIVVTYRGDARILHSGLSCVTSRAGVLAQRNRRLAYKAPEQLRIGVNAVPIGPAADVFAVGVLLWEILHGRRRFDGASDAEVVERILHGNVAPVEPGDYRIPIALLPLIEMALEPTPERRIANAAQFGDAIEHAPGVRLATTEEVAHIVDDLVGTFIERRRAQIDELFAQAEERSPSDSTLRPAIVSHLRRAGAMKTPVGLVYPPPSTNPLARSVSVAPSERWIDASLPPPSTRAQFSESGFDIGSGLPGRHRDTSGSLRAAKPKPLRSRLKPKGAIGWLYYVALGAIVGGLVFEFVIESPPSDLPPASATIISHPGGDPPPSMTNTAPMPTAPSALGADPPPRPEPTSEPADLDRARAAAMRPAFPTPAPVPAPPAPMPARGRASATKPARGAPRPAEQTSPTPESPPPAPPVDSDWGI